MLVEKERYARGSTRREDLDSCVVLVPAAPGRLTAYPVSKDVNSVRNDGAHLIEPIPGRGTPGRRPIDAQDQLFVTGSVRGCDDDRDRGRTPRG